jgi:ribosomal protein S18 acetylase RimI-like enzyme
MNEIRKATLKDILAIVSLIRELAQAGGETSPISEAYAAGYLAAPDSRVLLAEDSSGVTGLLSYSVRPDLYHAGLCCMVEELVVAGDKRGRGTGGALLEVLLAQGQASGWVEVSVGVMRENLRAQEFYRRHGLLDEALLLEKHLGRLNRA